MSRDVLASNGRTRVWLVLGLGASVTWGCAALLGVEEAECDPKVDDACGERDVVTDSVPATEGEATTAPAEAPTTGEEETTAPVVALTLDEACAEYCELVIDACADIPQFKTESGCMTVCKAMYHLSEDGSATGNTVECRMQAADNALNFSDGLEDNCVTAGPLGPACGGACNNYCEQIEHYCPEEFEKMTDCIDECRAVPRADVPYTDGFPSGNTLECRIYHVQLAVVQQPNRLTHCGHAAGRSLCVAP